MEKNKDYRRCWNSLILEGAMLAGAAASIILLFSNSGFAYERYNDGCMECHGSFTGSKSTKGSVFPSGNKHEMHRSSSYMNTDCDLCHSSGDGRDPFIGSSNGTANNPGLGCTGCHVTAGLRQHHMVNGVVDQYGDDCSSCHSIGTPSDESVNPPYYGTPDTEADNACNDVLAANINENWTIGDFVGLDNDGDNLYDLADYSCGPFRMVDAVPDGNDIRIRWETAGGRTEQVQATSVLTNAFSSIGTAVTIPGVGIVTQEIVEVNGASGAARFYRIRSIP